MELGRARPDVVAITAAMLGPTGLAPFAEAFPDRCFDVGIAEQHALTSAAGLAAGGLHPVVAIYSTFLNRAFDQLLMDVALHRQAVTLVLDRAGVTGNDGPSHNGMWDLSILGVVPGMRVAAPRDAETLREELAEAVAIDDGPTALRFPKGAVIGSVPAVRRIGGVDVLREPDLDEAGLDHPAEPQVLLVCVGAFAELGVAAARAAGGAGRGGDGRRPAVGPADPGRAGRPRRGAPARGHRHRQRAARRVRLGAGGRPAGRRVRRPAARRRAAPGVPRARQPGGRPGRGGPDGAGRRTPRDGVGGRAARGPGRRGGGPPSAAAGHPRPRPLRARTSCATSGPRSRRADAGAGGRGRARAGRRHRPRAAPRGDGRRRRVRRRHRAREVDDHPLRRGRAGPRPARHAGRPAVRGDRLARGRRRGC